MTTSVLRQGRSPGVVHVVRPRRSAVPPRPVEPGPLKLGLIRIRLRSRGDGYSNQVKERWLLRGLIVLVRYPGPRFTDRRGRWEWVRGCPEAGTPSRWAFMGGA